MLTKFPEQRVCAAQPDLGSNGTPIYVLCRIDAASGEGIQSPQHAISSEKQDHYLIYHIMLSVGSDSRKKFGAGNMSGRVNRRTPGILPIKSGDQRVSIDPGSAQPISCFLRKRTKALGGQGPTIPTLLGPHTQPTGEYQDEFSLQDCRDVVIAAVAMLEGLYVHLPMKRAMYAVDPVRRLKLLLMRVERYLELTKQNRAKDDETGENVPTDDLWFHQEMCEALASVHDRHTMYVMPEPFASSVALLPFQIEDYFESRAAVDRTPSDGLAEPSLTRHYVVSRILADHDGRFDWFRDTRGKLTTAPSHFREGAIVTHWNGMRIEHAVDLIGAENSGGNAEARHARGLSRLTVRTLARSLPPKEEWVTVRYLDRNKEPRDLVAEWRVCELKPNLTGSQIILTGLRKAKQHPAAGLDLEQDVAHIFREWASRTLKRTQRRRVASASRATARPMASPEYFEVGQACRWKNAASEVKTFGYIRLRSFKFEDHQGFLNAFVKTVTAKGFPQDGLILDIRDNPGGYIATGERLLQILTPRTIQPQPMQFIGTPLTLQICSWWGSAFRQWKPSLERAMMTGATYSAASPTTAPELCNDIGQRYYGPVVLVTNALCYSTSDIFAAGFQDHEIGKIVGTDFLTGAGGANVETFASLRAVYDNAHEPMLRLLRTKDLQYDIFPPWSFGVRQLHGSDLRVAFRRSVRVGTHAGEELEDIGVSVDYRHYMTRDDVLNDNKDLRAKACELLDGMPGYIFRVQDENVIDWGADKFGMIMQTRGIERIDVMTNNVLRCQQPITDPAGVSTVRIRFDWPRDAAHQKRQSLNLYGYAEQKLVAVRKMQPWR